MSQAAPDPADDPDPKEDALFRQVFAKETRPLLAQRLTLLSWTMAGVLGAYFVLTLFYEAPWRWITLATALMFLLAGAALRWLSVARNRASWMAPLVIVLTMTAFVVTGWGNAGAFEGVDLGLMVLVSAVFLPIEGRHVIALSILALALVLLLAFIDPTPQQWLADALAYVIACCILATVTRFASNRLRRRELQARLAAEVERQRAETLLLNILPEPIATRLKQHESPIADGFADVSVLFADIVGFTPLSQRIEPKRLVALLDEIFSTFDALTETHGLEKIKTIGDAYMAVGGVPEARDDHAQAVARLALDIRRAVRDYSARCGEPLQIRIGINSGAVVAGVIGTKKFIYDLWGDAVNTASRMESHGQADAIQVSEATYQVLKDEFELEARGKIEVKGKGAMATYLLLGQRPSVAASRGTQGKDAGQDSPPSRSSD
jgi:class 3 adenylate cyclase